MYFTQCIFLLYVTTCTNYILFCFKSGFLFIYILQLHLVTLLCRLFTISPSACISFIRSPELKAQVSYTNRPLSVRLSVNVYIFDFLSRITGPVLTRLGTKHHWVKGIQVCSNKGDSSSPRGDNSERVKIH
jgi:hypothetical protein